MIADWYPEVSFGGFSRVDGTLAFYLRVDALLEADSRVLDIGCGRGQASEDPSPYRRRMRTLRGRCAHVLGIDVDPTGAANPLVDEFRRLEDPARWPVEDASIDLAVSDYVLEHVDEPDLFFAECARIVKPGGSLCIRTPNLHGYVATLARILPKRLHGRVVGRAQKDRRPDDIFPTFYRCNTRRRIERSLARAGFRGCVYRHESEPTYLEFSRAAYGVGVFVHRHLPDPLKSNLFAFARRLPAS